MIIYLIGMTIVVCMLVYITITDEEIKEYDNRELIKLMFVMIILTLCSWFTLLMAIIYTGLKRIRDRK